VVRELTAVFAYFKHAREPGESFGDFCHRKGAEDILSWTEQFVAQALASA
jgi:sulfite reductase (ferredoxin)